MHPAQNRRPAPGRPDLPAAGRRAGTGSSRSPSCGTMLVADSQLEPGGCVAAGEAVAGWRARRGWSLPVPGWPGCGWPRSCGPGLRGSVTLIGAEDRPPYDRPPLSKKVLTGELDDTGLRADLESLSVDSAPGRDAPTGLRRRASCAPTLAEHEWDALVVATGASPVRLPGSGPQHVLRTADDALALRDLLTARHPAGHRRGWLDRGRARHGRGAPRLRGHGAGSSRGAARRGDRDRGRRRDRALVRRSRSGACG